MAVVEAEDSSHNDHLAYHIDHRVELQDRYSHDTQDQAQEDNEAYNLVVVVVEDTCLSHKAEVHVYSHHSHEYEAVAADSPCIP